MNKPEAKQILSDLLAAESKRPFSELQDFVCQERVTTLGPAGESGANYQVEIQYFWDGKPEGTIRIMASIDDGGIRAVIPLTDSELVAPPNPPFNPDPAAGIFRAL